LTSNYQLIQNITNLLLVSIASAVPGAFHAVMDMFKCVEMIRFNPNWSTNLQQQFIFTNEFIAI